MNKWTSGAIAGALLAFSAQSQGAVQIGGILVEPGFHIEIANIFHNPVFAVGDVLSGYGEVSSINGSSAFCAGGLGTCELTYTFGGYEVTSVNGNNVTFTGGWMNLYVGTGANNDFNPYASGGSADDLAAASNGTLWLTLMGHAYGASGDTMDGEWSTTLAGEQQFTLEGFFSVDHTGASNGNTAGAGAVANVHFDTDTYVAAFGGPADMLFGSDAYYSNAPHPGECAAQNLTSCMSGSADLAGNVIPAPGTLALMGLGLLGIAAANRRKARATH